jgi:cell division transport system ATP-binding protein
MIHFDSVSKVYDTEVFALKGIDLRIKKGEFVFITGTSGAGKSTLLKLLYGELKPASGNVFVQGVAVDTLNRNKLAYLRRQMGIVFQDFKLLWDRTVLENICLPFSVWGVRKDYMKPVERFMKELDIWKYRDLYPHQVSGGEQQKIAICRALVVEPWILVADEPTGNLDPKSATDIFNIFNRASKAGATVIFATHNEKLTSLHSGRIVKLEKGRLA